MTVRRERASADSLRKTEEAPRVDSGMHVLLRTERLILRRMTADDADALFDLDSDPEVMRFLNGGTPTPRDVLETKILPLFLRYDDRLPGRGFFAAIERTTGEFLGWFCSRSKETRDPRDRRRTDPERGRGSPAEVELGFRLRRGAWGKGYATEGARALIEFGFGTLGIRRVIAFVYEENAASRRVLEKAGLHAVRKIRLNPEQLADCGTYYVPPPGQGASLQGDDLQYELTIEEWRAAVEARRSAVR